MATTPDLTLPAEVPEMEQYHDTPENLVPFALYTLCEMNDQTLEDYRRRAASECEDDMVKIPPQARFVEQSLQDIVDYHVQLGLGREFDPVYFLVCVYPDSAAILVVTLDDDDLECKPDRLWSKFEESGLTLVNLQIANVDWSEAKEGALDGPDDAGDDDAGDDDAGGDDAGDDDAEDDTDDADKGSKDDPDTGEEDYGPPPPLGFHIQVYTVPGVDIDALLTKMEPGSYLKKPDRSDWVCKAHKLPKDGERDPTAYAAKLHPLQCFKHPSLTTKYFIVADEPNFAEEGVAIVNIDWDGKTNGKSSIQLLDFGQSLMVQTQRAEVPDTATRAAVGTVCMLAQGYQKWDPKVKQFAIYYTNTSDADIKLASAIDSRWEKRGHGEGRVALGGSMKPEEIEKGGGFWPALIRRHFAYCKRQKFVPSFVREYFVYCDDEVPAAGSEVKLVKLEWNGDLRLVDAVVKEYEEKTSAMKVPASKAHKSLTDISNGGEDWEGERVT